MTRRLLVGTTLAVLLAVALGCGQAAAPASPSPAPAGTSAAPDGSTLKATAPGLVSPVGNVQLDTLEPVFTLQNASGLYTDASFDYRIELQTADGESVTNPRVGPGPNGQTVWEIPFLLELDTTYRWRARAEIADDFGPWSPFELFRSLDYQGIVPRPPGGVWPSEPTEVLALIAAHFSEYLEPTGSLGEREENTEFLRDRIIEAGICGGLDLALNLKRGFGPHSTDALAWAIEGDVEVVDFALAFDDFGGTMALAWQIVDGPAGYDPYPDHPGC